MTNAAALNPQVVLLADRHGLELDPTSLRFEEAGLDFRVVFARTTDGTEWVLRIPRRPELAETIEAEGHILRFARRVLTVAVPDWRVVGGGLVAYPSLPGSPGLTLDAGTPVWHVEIGSTRFARSLGTLIAELHAASPTDAAASGVPVRTPAELREEFAAQLARTVAEFTVSDDLRDRWRARLDDDGLWPEQPVFTHGELYPAHLLLDAQDRILSVLDWTTAQVGDPAVDFAYQHMMAPPEAFDLTVRAYVDAGHDEPPRLRDRCAEIIAAAPVAYAVFALETGAPEHREAAQAQLLAT